MGRNSADLYLSDEHFDRIRVGFLGQLKIIIRCFCAVAISVLVQSQVLVALLVQRHLLLRVRLSCSHCKHLFSIFSYSSKSLVRSHRSWATIFLQLFYPLAAIHSLTPDVCKCALLYKNLTTIHDNCVINATNSTIRNKNQRDREFLSSFSKVHGVLKNLNSAQWERKTKQGHQGLLTASETTKDGDHVAEYE